MSAVVSEKGDEAAAPSAKWLSMSTGAADWRRTELEEMFKIHVKVLEFAGCDEGNLPAEIPNEDGVISLQAKPFGGAHIEEFFQRITAEGMHIGCAPRMLVVEGYEGCGKVYNVIYYAAMNSINVLLVRQNAYSSPECSGLMHLIFEEAKKRQPSIVLFEDAEHLFYATPGGVNVAHHMHRELLPCENEVRRLTENDRVWLVLTSDRSPKTIQKPFSVYLQDRGMLAFVDARTPDEVRQRFVREQLARFMYTDADKVPVNAVNRIVQHSKHASFREILNFIRRTLNHVVGQASGQAQQNNARLYSDENLKMAIQQCLYTHNSKDPHTHKVFSECTVAPRPDAIHTHENWAKDFRECVEMRLAMCCPSQMIVTQARNQLNARRYAPPPPPPPPTKSIVSKQRDPWGFNDSGSSSDEDDENASCRDDETASASSSMSTEEMNRINQQRVERLRNQPELLAHHIGNSVTPSRSEPPSPSVVVSDRLHASLTIHSQQASPAEKPATALGTPPRMPSSTSCSKFPLCPIPARVNSPKRSASAEPLLENTRDNSLTPPPAKRRPRKALLNFI